MGKYTYVDMTSDWVMGKYTCRYEFWLGYG